MIARSPLRFGRWLTPLLLAGAIIAVVDLAEAARGLVVYKRGGCDYHIVDTRSGFALLEWYGGNGLYGGNDPGEGDELAGNLESYGPKTIRNLTAGSAAIARVEAYGLSRSQAMERYGNHCLYEALVKEPPQTAEGLSAFSELAAHLGHRSNQVAILGRLRREFPEHRRSRQAALDLAHRAFIHLELKDVVALAGDAAQSDDEKVRVEAWLLKGEAELKLKRFHDAIKSFQNVGSIASAEPSVRYRALAGLGLAHEELQQFRSALTAYESAASYSPDTVLRNWAQERLKVVSARVTKTP